MTATRHRSFGSKPKIKENVTFELEGQTFTALPSIPGALLLDFVADADVDDPTKSAEAVLSFFEVVLIPEDVDRFASFIRDPNYSVGIETIVEIVEWLIGIYSSNPTPQPAPSPRGRSKNGRGSTAQLSVVAE